MANTKSIDIEKSSSQCAYIADASQTGLDLGATFTIEAWLNAESLPRDGAYRAFVGKWQTTGNNRSYVARLNNTGGVYTIQMVSDANGASGSSTIISSDALTFSSSTWYHIAISVSSGKVSFYQDAVAKGGAAGLATPYNGAAAFVIGAEQQGGAYGWDGLIDDVRVWSTARTQQNISDYRSTELVGNESGLVGYWKFNNNYEDATSNNNDLTGYNTPTFSTSVPFTDIDYTLVCDKGEFVLTGNNASLLASRKLTCSMGSFVLTGIDVALKAARKIVMETGSYILTGNPIVINLKKWIEKTKNAGSWSEKTKNDGSWSEKTKN